LLLLFFVFFFFFLFFVFLKLLENGVGVAVELVPVLFVVHQDLGSHFIDQFQQHFASVIAVAQRRVRTNTQDMRSFVFFLHEPPYLALLLVLPAWSEAVEEFALDVVLCALLDRVFLGQVNCLRSRNCSTLCVFASSVFGVTVGFPFGLHVFGFAVLFQLLFDLRLNVTLVFVSQRLFETPQENQVLKVLNDMLSDAPEPVGTFQPRILVGLCILVVTFPNPCALKN